MSVDQTIFRKSRNFISEMSNKYMNLLLFVSYSLFGNMEENLGWLFVFKKSFFKKISEIFKIDLK